MMYVNKLTGASFESACKCQGKNWEKAENSGKKKTPAKTGQKRVKK